MRTTYCFLFGFFVSLPGLAVSAEPAGQVVDAGTQARVVSHYDRLPMSFEANQGQVDPEVRFIARGPGYSLYLTPAEVVLSLRAVAPSDAETLSTTVVRMRLADAAPTPVLSGIDRLPGTSNYFIGNDPARWQSAIPNYAKVKYTDIYPGIDLVYYGKQQQLEFDFIVAPGADPRRIVLEFEGTTTMALDADGNLVLATNAGTVVQRKPLIYQDIDGIRHTIDCHYRVDGKQQVRVEIAHYDATRPLVIDPVLVYSTYLGGGFAQGKGIATDRDGNVYVTGQTISSPFPTTPGAYQVAFGGGGDAFVTKLNSTVAAVIYSTYLGGTGGDFGEAIAVDAGGNAYVTGSTHGGFPTTPGAYQVTYGGGFDDAFVTKLNSTGDALVYSTYLGGVNSDSGFSIAINGSGRAFVTGRTYGGFPTTPEAYQRTFGGQFDAFVAEVHTSGSALLYSTYLGGTDEEQGYAIALDRNGYAYVTGFTRGDFPTTPGAYQTTSSGALSDAFVVKLAFLDAAVEYHHSAFDHYFVTSLPNEIAALDSGTFSGWNRTGLSFPTYVLDTPGTANVCRFWSAQTFAPKSSHFYTPYADECATVKQDPAWRLEGHAFALRLPEAGLGYVSCPSDTRPLYRAYNRGMSGAPNHRYTTDLAVLEEMVARGWQVEGDLWTRIFACVPAQE